MTDVFSKQKRSWVMSRIRGKNTKPELLVRSLLHQLGYRFTVNAANNKRLPGKPDIVLPKWKLVIFVHGCFWHGHRGCKDFRLPKTRTDWWREKLEGNHTRVCFVTDTKQKEWERWVSCGSLLHNRQPFMIRAV